jgi:hypothetical protein
LEGKIMRKLFAVGLVMLLAACHDSTAPDPYARQHIIKTNVVACDNAGYNLQVSWVDWNWQAIFLRGGQQVANVSDSSLTHDSGCVYALGDKAHVKLVPLNGIEKYLDSAFVDVIIQPTQ